MNSLAKAVILDIDTFKPHDLDLSPLLSLPLAWQVFGTTSDDKVQARIRDCQVVLTNKVPLTHAVLAEADKLQYIGVLATGTNNIDHQAARRGNITVTNVAGYGTASVVQHTMMLMLNLATGFGSYQRDVKAGQWQQAKTFCLLDHPIAELAGKHLVILGSGELGQGVKKLAEAFGMRVTIASRPGQPSSEQRPDFDEVLGTADFVSLHCLLSEQTEGLINESRLASMKPSAFLINTARGPLVDETALLAALQQGQIAGAAVDVVSTEPPPVDHPLVNARLDNLIVTPHNAWGSVESRQRLLNLAAKQLSDFLRQHCQT